MKQADIWYEIYSENKRFSTRAKDPFTAFFKALWIGWRCYFVLNPQRVVVEKWGKV